MVCEGVEMQLADLQTFMCKKWPKFQKSHEKSTFQKYNFFSAQQYVFLFLFLKKSRRLSLRTFSSVVLLNSMNSPTARTWVSEKQCVFGFCNHVDADIFAYDFHRFEIICGYWHHKNTVEIFIGGLHFRQIISYLLIF